MISEVITSVIDDIRGKCSIPVYHEQAPSENEKLPYVIFEIMPGSLDVDRAWESSGGEKVSKTFTFLFGLSVYADDSDGHKKIYNITEEFFDKLDYKKMTVVGATNVSVWNVFYGDVFWDGTGVAAMEPIYRVVGTLTGDFTNG
jgi:hypothetical protein